MVTRPGAKVGQLHAVIGRLNVFFLADIATVILIEQLEYNLDDLVLLRLWDCGSTLVEETVGLADVVGRPLAGAVVVVQGEEGTGVEGGDVVLLCDSSGQQVARDSLSRI